MITMATNLHFLLVNDGEATPISFRPERDSTMWWGRRDALARCTAAALWVYQRSPNESQNGGAWLYLYFSGDGSVLRHGPAFASAMSVPTERRLVAAWRLASASGQVKGLTCLRQPKIMAEMDGNSRSGKRSYQRNSGKVGTLGKRQLLAHLQVGR